MTDCPEQLTFSFHPSKDIVVDFEGGQISSDAGLLPLIELDRRLGWSAQLAALLHDDRQAAKTEHELPQLLRQRFFGLIAGYEDCNDHTRLRDDPILKVAAGKPLTKPLASQPTFSRFENAVTAREVAQINRWLPEQYV